MSEVEADDIVTQQVTDALLLFFNGPEIALQVRIDALTDMLATLIGGDAEQFDRCLDRMSRKIDAQRSIQSSSISPEASSLNSVSP